jgi:hypothetical protein
MASKPLPFDPSATCVWPFIAAAARPSSGAAAMPADGSRWGNGAGRMPRPRVGEQVRHWPSASFQQFGQMYCRHDMQKLKVLWNASSCCDVSERSVSSRAAAIASSIEVLSSRTKFFRPRERTLTPRSRARGTADSKV